jgi:hypothetical protein
VGGPQTEDDHTGVDIPGHIAGLRNQKTFPGTGAAWKAVAMLRLEA